MNQIAKREPSKYSTKKHFVYSPLYHQWKSEAKKNGADSTLAIDLSCRHSRAIGVMGNERCGAE